MLRLLGIYTARAGVAATMIGQNVPSICPPILQLRRASTLASKLTLRDYQLECISSVLQALKQGHKRLGVSLATGSGKTVIFTQLIDQVDGRPAGDRTLILAHRRELVEQAARHCQFAHPDKKIEIEMGSLHASGSADITVASIYSITSRDRLLKYDPSAFKLVLVDEAHHIVAPGYLRTLEHFGLDKKKDESPALIGLSATFSRFDGLKLGVAIDQIVYHKDYVDMISDKWLSDVILTTVKSPVNLAKVRSNSFGDFQTGDLSAVVNTDAVNDITVRSWIAKAVERKSTLVFCVDLAHVVGLSNKYRLYGYDARFITGNTSKQDRARTLEAFKNGEFPVLVNCGVFTEGTDIPNIDCIVLARPTRSRNLLVQMIGRGMRLHPDKKNCHIIDFVSNLETGIITTPTLFGLDPNELLDKESVINIKDKMVEDDRGQLDTTATALKPGSNRSVAFTDYGSILDYIADSSDEKHIHQLSQNAWVSAGRNRYVLSCDRSTHLTIEAVDKIDAPDADSDTEADSVKVKEDSKDAKVKDGAKDAKDAKAAYQVTASRLVTHMSQTKGLRRYTEHQPVLLAQTFEDAVHGADTFATDSFSQLIINRYQAWRSLPASPGQLDFINKIRGDAEPLTEDQVSKGRAADMITKIKHGARGQFEKIKAEEKQRMKKATRAEATRDREIVRVGPVVA